MDNLTIALDAMSGDFGPRVIVPAALQALDLHQNLHLILVGSSAEINIFLPNKHPRLTVIKSSSVIPNDMKPSLAIRRSQGSSMRMALELVNSKEAQACVSAGNTGALMGLSKLLLHSISGIKRPALVATLPTINNGNTVILDLGANIESDSEMLVQFAIMGSILANTVLNIVNPRVALLNIGKEDIKGLERIRVAANKLKTNHYFNFVGYLEGDELLSGKTDVLVCDGFTGNVTLKTVEGLIKIFLSSNQLMTKNKSIFARLTRYWMQKKMMNYFGHLDPNHYNGACLLGLQSIVIKSHGAASQSSFLAAIEHAILAIENNLPERIASSLSSILPKSEKN